MRPGGPECPVRSTLFQLLDDPLIADCTYVDNQNLHLLPIRRLAMRDFVKRPEQTMDRPAVQACVHALCIAGE